jgi:hypothetical protein
MPENDVDTDAANQTDVAPEADVDQDSTDAQAADDDSQDSLDPKTKSVLDKARREAAALRRRLKELEPLAKKLKELEDKDKSESERLAGQLADLQKEIGEYKVREVRLAAATEAGLPADMASFITATDPDEAKAQAKQLLEWRKGSGTPDLRQGARKTAPQKPSPDDFLRQMAGRK